MPVAHGLARIAGSTAAGLSQPSHGLGQTGIGTDAVTVRDNQMHANLNMGIGRNAECRARTGRARALHIPAARARPRSPLSSPCAQHAPACSRHKKPLAWGGHHETHMHELRPHFAVLSCTTRAADRLHAHTIRQGLDSGCALHSLPQPMTDPFGAYAGPTGPERLIHSSQHPTRFGSV